MCDQGPNITKKRQNPRGMSLRLVAVSCLLQTLSGCFGNGDDGREALQQALARALPDRDLTQTPIWPEGRLEISGHFELQSSGQNWRVEIKRSSHIRGDGAMRLSDERSWRSVEQVGTPDELREERDDRFEGVFDGKRWVTRRGFGPWIERETSDGHHRTTQERVRDWLPELVMAFDSSLARTPTADSVVMIGGREATWQRLSLRAPIDRPTAVDLVALRDHETTWPVWFTATHTVHKVTGRLAVSAASEVLAGEIEIEGVALVDGREYRFTAAGRHVFSPLDAAPDGAVDFAIPTAVLPADRHRVWPMIREVLGDGLSPQWGGPPKAP